MDLTQDFKELLTLLNEHKVKYLVVGGYAVNHYGYPRYTSDIDLWVWIEETNAQNILNALIDFGFSSANLLVKDFLTPENIIQLGYPPHRVDIMTTVDGLSFEESFKNRNLVVYDNVKIPFIGLKDLLTNKRKTSRLQDLADAENLYKVNRTQLDESE